MADCFFSFGRSCSGCAEYAAVDGYRTHPFLVCMARPGWFPPSVEAGVEDLVFAAAVEGIGAYFRLVWSFEFRPLLLLVCFGAQLISVCHRCLGVHPWRTRAAGQAQYKSLGGNVRA